MNKEGSFGNEFIKRKGKARGNGKDVLEERR